MKFPFEEPLAWFLSEYQKAIDLKIHEPHAMQLATAHPGQCPSVRTVLYKGLIRGGLSFYTNYHSKKSRDLAAFPQAGLNFFWPTLQQQIRFEGPVEKLTRAESEAYFKTRARLSQLGAWASEQSEVIPDLEWLEKRVDFFTEKFGKGEIPCPPNWGGFHLIPLKAEFWFGREGRLHERYVFERTSGGSATWKNVLKSP